ncbi:hypothetical protein SCHPADRAFT_908550 [Schizopora paradoxa]|uniref:Thioredoxin-like fold domain-containing protein n=1 Tax=Schizopora paradoxa TaxID=27342 RepID=A0A0H2RAV2_9AGAM|nr:hypothetical protein SCHPADRAFT_908550 [Schizopora paradoxa]
MKLSSAFCLSLSWAVSAQYFSEGWKPGQPVARGTGYSYETVAASTAYQAQATQDAPAVPASPKSLFDLTTYLESGPLKALFSRAGVNITEKLEESRALNKIWDERIPFINDDNYEEMIVNEEFESLEEERDRVWFLVITVSSAQNEGISRYVDSEFDNAYNLTLQENDLPNVRWGRIDYMNVTALTTKWAVWRAPYLVVLKDRGQSLRFYRPHQLRIKGDLMRQFLKVNAYEQTGPWKSAFGPGGKREFVLDWLAVVLTKTYNVMVVIPRWLLLLISGGLASGLVNLLHRNSASSAPPPAAAPAPTVAKAQAAPSAPAAPSKAASSGKPSGGAKQRKGGKK